jgi:hypothetical protein
MSAHVDSKPCKALEGLLQRVADGRAKGLERAYALAHAARCTGCGTFLERMRATLTVLRTAAKSEPPADAMDRLRAQIDALGGSNPGPMGPGD